MDMKQKQFTTLMNDYPAILAHGLSSQAYLGTLVRFCEAIAMHVLEGRKTDFNTPLFDEVQALAKRTNTPIEHCAVMLQHSVSNGEHFSLTFDALRKQLAIPSNILDLAEVLTRRSGESYGNHHYRLITNHTAVNLMLAELVERANITKYSHPAKEQHVRCCGLLDRAMVLKNYQGYHLLEEEVISDMLIDLNSVTPLEVVHRVQSENQEMVEYYFKGGLIPEATAEFSWHDGVATVLFNWGSNTKEYLHYSFKNQSVTAKITQNEFADYIGIHYWAYDKHLSAQ